MSHNEKIFRVIFKFLLSTGQGVPLVTMATNFRPSAGILLVLHSLITRLNPVQADSSLWKRASQRRIFFRSKITHTDCYVGIR